MTKNSALGDASPGLVEQAEKWMAICPMPPEPCGSCDLIRGLLAALALSGAETARLKGELEAAEQHVVICRAASDAHHSRAEHAEAELARVSQLYHELLYEVAKKHPAESRHETARRYIRQAETPDPNACASAIPVSPTQKEST